MSALTNIIWKYRKVRGQWRRIRRLLFPSPAELRFIDLMGGTYTTINWIRRPATRFPLAIVWDIGPALKAEMFKREIKAGRYYVDFGNDIFWGFEIDGQKWHRDVVREFDRDSYLYTRGWRLMHIEAARMWRDPDRVKYDILKFLYT